MRTLSGECNGNLTRFAHTEAGCVLDFHESISGLTHRPTGYPSGGPSGLEIEPSGQTVQVQQFPSEIEPGAEAAFHGFEIHFAQTHPAAGDELIFVKALPDHWKFGAAKLLDELMLGRT